MFKTKPFKHQLKEYETGRDLPARCLWWEMGIGKTKVVLDTAAHLFLRGEIGGLLIIAPNGVHQNWTADEIPKHMPDGARAHCFLWETRKKGTKYFQDAFDRFMVADDGLAVLALSYHAIMTKAGAKAAKKFLTSRPCLYVADESTCFKTPKAKTTKRVLASAKYAPYRRVLNGTPVADSPFDAYTQVRFADPTAWARAFGIGSFSEFKTFFGIWKQEQKGKKKFPLFVEYRNLDLMHRVMDEVGSRLLKSDVLDLPPRLYSKVYFDLSPEQRWTYDELFEEFQTWLDGDSVTAELAIVRMTRLQQVASGYVPVDDEAAKRPSDREPPRMIGTDRPRIRALVELLKQVPRQAIIWAKYSLDVDLIAEAIRASGWSHVIYDGRTSPDERLRARRAFQAGDVKFFISKPTCAGLGLNLTAADTVIYYNNLFSLDKRLQSEARPHRIGQLRAVYYIDLIASNTIDGYILKKLRGKKRVAAVVTGDQLEEWI